MGIFKTNIDLTVDYGRVIEKLKRKIDDKQFFKGYFDKTKSVIYFFSNFLPNPFNVYSPIVEVEIQDLQENGLRISFKIISLYLIALGLAIVFSWTGFIFMIIHYGPRSFPGIILPLAASIGFPLLLKHSFDCELLHFRNVLREIEREIADYDLMKGQDG